MIKTLIKATTFIKLKIITLTKLKTITLVKLKINKIKFIIISTLTIIAKLRKKTIFIIIYKY